MSKRAIMEDLGRSSGRPAARQTLGAALWPAAICTTSAVPSPADKLDDAEPVAMRVEAERLGVDGDRVLVARRVGEIALVKADRHDRFPSPKPLTFLGGCGEIGDDRRAIGNDGERLEEEAPWARSARRQRQWHVRPAVGTTGAGRTARTIPQDPTAGKPDRPAPLRPRSAGSGLKSTRPRVCLGPSVKIPRGVQVSR